MKKRKKKNKKMASFGKKGFEGLARRVGKENLSTYYRDLAFRRWPNRPE